MDDKTKEEIALFRIAVLGPLVGAELEHGDLLELCRQAAERRWEWPDGTLGRVEARTVENWYYAYRRGGFEALKPKDRKDLGQSEIRTEVADLLLRAKRERPRCSLRRLIRMMELAGKRPARELSLLGSPLAGTPRSSRRPLRHRREAPFIYEFAGELLVGDALHLAAGSRPDGRPRKSTCSPRLTARPATSGEHLRFSEDAATQERGQERAARPGLWQRYYVDPARPMSPVRSSSSAPSWASSCCTRGPAMRRPRA